MSELLTNPKALVILLCLGGAIVGLNLTLFGLLRGSRSVQAEASKWGKALGGGQELRTRQEAQLSELHQAVAQFKPAPKPNPEEHPTSRSHD